MLMRNNYTTAMEMCTHSKQEEAQQQIHSLCAAPQGLYPHCSSELQLLEPREPSQPCLTQGRLQPLLLGLVFAHGESRV